MTPMTPAQITLTLGKREFIVSASVSLRHQELPEPDDFLVVDVATGEVVDTYGWLHDWIPEAYGEPEAGQTPGQLKAWARVRRVIAIEDISQLLYDAATDAAEAALDEAMENKMDGMRNGDFGSVLSIRYGGKYRPL